MDYPELLLFGGTFDPPHEGHSKCLRAALGIFPVEVLVVPAFAPPQSSGQVKPTKTSYHHRLKMADIHFSSESFPVKVVVSDLEASLPQPSYTLQTIEYLVEHQSKSLSLVIGYDQLENFHRWHGVDQILRQVHLCIVNRGGASVKDRVKILGDKLGLNLLDHSTHMEWAGLKKGVWWVEHSVSSLSSTHLRQDEALSSGIHPKVLHYIKENKLYKC